jgi:hypothetical protein
MVMVMVMVSTIIIIIIITITIITIAPHLGVLQGGQLHQHLHTAKDTTLSGPRKGHKAQTPSHPAEHYSSIHHR